MARLFVLDAMGLAYRAFHALITRRDKTLEEIAEEKKANPEKEPSPFKWEPLKNSLGEPTNAILGFANTVLKVRREEKPDYWALAWDGPGPTFRHERFPNYKATRRPIPDDLRSQIGPIAEMAQALGLPLIDVPGVEADDVMATLAARGERDGLEVALVTSDKDMLQLVNDRVRLLSPVGRGEEYSWIDPRAVLQKWKVPPAAVRDVLALMGDSVDNIPGVPGIGEKTATDIIKEFGSLDALYENLGRVTKPSVRAKLEAHREQAFLSRELVTVKTDCELPLGWDDLKVPPIRRDEFQQLTTRYELGALAKRVLEQGWADDPAPAPEAPPEMEPESDDRIPWPPDATPARAIDSRPMSTEPLESSMDVDAAVAFSVPEPARGRAPRQATLDLWSPETGTIETLAPSVEPAAPIGDAALEPLVERIHAVRARAIHGLALLPIAEGHDARHATVVGLAVAARDGTACYLPLAHAAGPNLPLERVREWLAPALADPTVEKVSAHLKRDLHLLAGLGLTVEGALIDAYVASFLCDPSRDHDLAGLARDFLGIAVPPLLAPAGSRAGRGLGPSALAVEEAAAAAGRTAALLFPLADAIRAQLEARDHWTLFERLERPLTPVLLEMELAGIAVDRAILEEMGARAGEEIARLERELYALAGGPLNLNSGPQLAKLLFETFNLKSGRRTKTGYSTDQAVLEELAGAHPFPAKLLEYRVLSKLRSTYFDALPLAIDPRDGRVHTSYDQAGAATGRLSSSNPNLQNIPMRTPIGRAIRKAFVAPPGSVLVSADYSQIELRVMAHLSGDARLIAAFQSGEDVHASTARQVFGVTGDLDPALRARAKVVNFGVMYGMGARSLSQQMGISLSEAQHFIANYFRVFAGVREYLDSTVAEGRRRGYVQTLLGRRRYLSGLNSTRGNERANSERAAINAPIQGSAADLMKLAMIRVRAALKQHRPSARLLLQVHDELLLECPSEEVDPVSTIVRAEMEGCFTLRVPLTVSVGRGATWFDAH